MKTHPNCIPCFQRQVIQALGFVSDDFDLIESVLRRTVNHLSSVEWNTSPFLMANEVHHLVREELGGMDPYKEIKKKSNDLMMRKYDELEEVVQDSRNPIDTAIRLSIAGNIIDYGVMEEFDIESTIDDVLVNDFAVDQRVKLLNSLDGRRYIWYIADNAGEIVLDKLLLETIFNHYDVEKVFFVVRGAPFINDATIDDAKYINLNKLDAIELIEWDIGYFGIKSDSKGFLKKFKPDETVISKGQGNYEAMSDIDGIFHMLMVKCPVVSTDIGVDKGSMVVWRKDA